jgi:hypothetical protein
MCCLYRYCGMVERLKRNKNNGSFFNALAVIFIEE